MSKKNPDAFCLIPARSGSKRFKNKNIKKINGAPLLGITIRTAIESDVFNKIYVSTNSKEYAEIAEKYGAEVPYIRPKHLATDKSFVIDVCLNFLKYLESHNLLLRYRIMCVLYPTSVLRTDEDINNAIRLFKNSSCHYLMSVTLLKPNPFRALKKIRHRLKLYWPEYEMIKSQFLPEAYVDNGSIYIIDIPTFLRNPTFYGNDLIGYVMPRERSIDVDTPEDFEILKYFYHRQRKKTK